MPLDVALCLFWLLGVQRNINAHAHLLKLGNFGAGSFEPGVIGIKNGLDFSAGVGYIPLVYHIKIAHTYETAIIKATTAKNGSITEKCTVCGDNCSKNIYRTGNQRLSKVQAHIIIKE